MLPIATLIAFGSTICKWAASGFDPVNILAFRRQHGHGENFVVAQDVKRTYMQNFDGCKVNFIDLDGLIDELS